MSFRRALPLLAALALYVLLAVARATADRPMVDEAWFASPAINLVHTGSMHTSIIEPAGTFFEGIDRHTYWIPPAYPLALAAWFSLVPPDLLSMRLLSVIFGCVIIIATWTTVLKLSGDEGTAGLAAVLAAADFAVVRAGAVGRMDVMCAALGHGALAVYLCLRRPRWRVAFAAAHTLAALAVVTHPNGVLYVLGVMILCLRHDRGRLRASTLALGSLPYLGALGLWGVYIARDPAAFVRQLGGNASGRFSGLATPLLAFKQEIVVRYLAGGDSLMRAALAVPYALGLVGAVAVRPLAASPAVRTLALLAAAFFTCQWLLESLKLYFYTIHLAPLFTALFAFVVRWAWAAPRLRAGTALITSGFLAVHLAGTAYTIQRDSERADYRPVVEVIRARAEPADLIMGSAELAFGLGFDANLVDDVRLGFHSRRRPHIIVLDRRYREWIDQALPITEPAAAAHARAVLREFEPVSAAADYEVLVRRGPSTAR